MSINMKAFMKADLKSRGTMEFEGIDAFKDEKGNKIPFIVKCLSRKEIKEIRDLYRTSTVYRDKQNGGRPIVGSDGQVAMVKEYDSESAGLALMVAAFEQPKMDDPEMMKYYGVLNKLDMPQILFPNAADFSYANDCLLEACGLRNRKTDKETVEEIKN